MARVISGVLSGDTDNTEESRYWRFFPHQQPEQLRKKFIYASSKAEESI